MKLISDIVGTVQTIYESVEGKKKNLYIEGIFAQAEKANRNKRIYPKNILHKAIDTYITEYVERKRALGELNHPKEPSPNPKEACIFIKDLQWDGNDVLGKALVIEGTPNGDIVRALIDAGVVLGVSTRGLGSVSESKGISYVEEDYEIRAIDVVHNPSGIDCWVNGILENVEFFYDKGVLTEQTLDKYTRNAKRGNISEVAADFHTFVKTVLTNGK